MRYKKDIVEGEKINRAGMGDEPFSTLVAGVAATLGTLFFFFSSPFRFLFFFLGTTCGNEPCSTARDEGKSIATETAATIATLGSGSDDGASTLGLASAAGVVTPVCKIRIYEIQERYSGR